MYVWQTADYTAVKLISYSGVSPETALPITGPAFLPEDDGSQYDFAEVSGALCAECVVITEHHFERCNLAITRPLVF
jgi:hypothetical protein